MGRGGRAKVLAAGMNALLFLFGFGAEPARGEAERAGLSPAARFAIRRAHRALEDPRCQQIFRDFRDSSGRLLQERLDALGWDGQQYLESMLFYESSDRRTCESPRTLAMTVPGARVVYVCDSKFSSLIRREPSALWIAILHEQLHSLGLAENPPTSQEISRIVAQRCH